MNGAAPTTTIRFPLLHNFGLRIHVIKAVRTCIRAASLFEWCGAGIWINYDQLCLISERMIRISFINVHQRSSPHVLN